VHVDRALKVDTQHLASHMLRGAVLESLGYLPDAIAAFDQAILIHPPSSEAHANKAVILTRLGQFGEAIAACNAALIDNCDTAKIHRIRAAALRGSGQHAAAISALDIAIALRADFAAAHRERGEILAALKRYPEAVASFDLALRYAPDMPFVPGHAMAARQHICDWRDYAGQVAGLLDRVDAKQLAAEPGLLFSLPTTPSQQQQASSVYFLHIAKGAANPPPPRQPTGAKIRIGYFSADFYDHAVMAAIVGLFETHDRTSFETIAFSLMRRPLDAMQMRIRSAFDRFVDVSSMSDDAAARLAREMDIDIAFDLMGYTSHCRPGIFAARAAALEVAYLGYPGTMATACIDYILADRIVLPAEHRPFYTEKVCYLPHSYQAHTPKIIADRVFARQELGLPEDAFVFCSFNSSYKFTPDLFDSWARILIRVEGSVLWLPSTDPVAMKNLRAEAQDRGIAPNRIVFADYLADHPDHLARLRAADLFLDTFHFGAHTTASDSLWAGLPVLTMLGMTFASRVAASLLTALGLPDLIARDRAQYERMAVDLAHVPGRLAALRQRLQENRTEYPLFDMPRFTRNVEAAYRRMLSLHQAGRVSEDMEISDPLT
jgi:predicted O-linked N-acetylglucosamine transferase (SPINDLY family)